MNKLSRLTLALALVTTVKTAQAFSYNSDDLILVFKDGSSGVPSVDDVEYDLGSVSNLLNKAAGANITLFTDDGTVSGNFGDYSAARVILVAGDNPSGGSIGKNVWVSSVNLTAATALTGSGFNTVIAKIYAAEANAANNSGTASSFTDPVSDNNSFSYTVSAGPPANSTAVGTFGGLYTSARRTDGTNNGTMAFYQIPYNSSVGTGQLVGTIFWNTNGTVTFTVPGGGAAPLTPARITQIVRAGSNTQISFTTTNGNHYQLLYKTNFTQPTWTTNGAAGTVTGNNSVTNLTDPTTDARRFYRIQSF